MLHRGFFKKALRFSSGDNRCPFGNVLAKPARVIRMMIRQDQLLDRFTRHRFLDLGQRLDRIIVVKNLFRSLHHQYMIVEGYE